MIEDLNFQATAIPQEKKELSTYEIMFNIPEEKELLLISALFFAVYGWKPAKVGRLKLSSIPRWVEYAKKKMTWNDAYKLRAILKEKRQPLWRRILSKIKS